MTCLNHWIPAFAGMTEWRTGGQPDEEARSCLAKAGIHLPAAGRVIYSTHPRQPVAGGNAHNAAAPDLKLLQCNIQAKVLNWPFSPGFTKDDEQGAGIDHQSLF